MKSKEQTIISMYLENEHSETKESLMCFKMHGNEHNLISMIVKNMQDDEDFAGIVLTSSNLFNHLKKHKTKLRK